MYVPTYPQATGFVFLVTLIFAAFVNLDKNPDDLDDDDNTPTARVGYTRVFFAAYHSSWFSDRFCVCVCDCFIAVSDLFIPRRPSVEGG
jgi:hypothetical protein